MQKRLAIIIGSKGQDGRLLSNLLVEKGYEVLGIDKGSDVNVLDVSSIATCIKENQPTELYYLAAFHHSSQDRPMDDAELMKKSTEIHVDGLRNVLEAVEEYSKHTKVLYASSCLIFGDTDEDIQTEETEHKPNSAYAITKHQGMELCKEFSARGLFASSVILYNHESEYRAPKFISQKIVQTALDIRDGKADELVIGNLQAKVDWGYAGDYVDAMHKVLQLDTPDEFIVATGNTHTVQDWVDIAFEYAGLEVAKFVKENPDIVKAKRKTLVGDATKLRNATGWQPQTSFNDMVQRMLQVADTPNGEQTLSICIPTFNRAPFLERSLNSIVSQFNDSEVARRVNVVVLDNISQDNTTEVGERFASEHENVSFVVDFKHRGIAAGIIHAASLATGDYTWVFSDDDLMTPETLKEVLHAIDTYNADVMFTNMDGIVEDDKISTYNLLDVESDTFLRTRRDLFDFLETKFDKTIDFYTTFVSSWIIKSSIYTEHKAIFHQYNEKKDVFPFQTLVLYSDFDFSSLVIAKPIVLFRADNASWGKKNPVKQFFYHQELWKHHYGYLLELNKTYISETFADKVKKKHFKKWFEFPKLFVVVVLRKLGIFKFVQKLYKR